MMTATQDVPQGKLYHRQDVEKVADIIRRARPGFQPRLGMIIGTGFVNRTVLKISAVIGLILSIVFTILIYRNFEVKHDD